LGAQNQQKALVIDEFRSLRISNFGCFSCLIRLNKGKGDLGDRQDASGKIMAIFATVWPSSLILPAWNG
jgi:hypothetical protein